MAITVLSDQATSFDGLAIDASIHRFAIDARDLMLSRTRAQVAFVADHDFAEPLVFLDLDILANRPLAFLFARAFDTAVTVRNKRQMPINGGVIPAHNRRPDAVRDFFASVLEAYLGKYRDSAGWWGDQLAKNDVVSLPEPNPDQEIAFRSHGIDYLVLPGRQFNFSPHLLWLTLAFKRRNKYLLHFKGSRRKPFIEPFYDLHMGRSEASRARRIIRAYRSLA